MKLSKWEKAGAVLAGWFVLRGFGRRRHVRAGKRYVPGSPEQIQLFEVAARKEEVPESWASDPAFVKLLTKESSGYVGIPNYTYGSNIRKHPELWPGIWSDIRAGITPTISAATGLGQLQPSNVKVHYPDGLAGIGDAHNEAVGMLSYIRDRYGSPAKALEFHLANNWY